MLACPDPLSFLNDYDPVILPRSIVTKPDAQNAVMANAFQAYRAIEETSPFTTFFGLDIDTPSAHTPALEADDDTSSSLTSPIWTDLASFDFSLDQPAASSAVTGPSSCITDLVTISPIDLFLPLPCETNSAPTPSKKRRASPPLVPVISKVSSLEQQECFSKRKRLQQGTFTGTRNTSLSPVDITAPTQTRLYSGPPSKTSKREVPAAAAKKVATLRTVSETMGVDVETEINKSIEDKRRQNTVAARRSRMRKAEHLAELEDIIKQQQEQIQELEMKNEVWMRRALNSGWTETARAV